MSTSNSKPNSLVQLIDGKLYETEKATLIASDAQLSGSTWSKSLFLLRTSKGNYFIQQQKGQQIDYKIEPVSKEAATQWFSKLPNKAITFSEAFPGEKVEEA